jgi:hypothetical protein
MFPALSLLARLLRLSYKKPYVVQLNVSLMHHSGEFDIDKLSLIYAQISIRTMTSLIRDDSTRRPRNLQTPVPRR